MKEPRGDGPEDHARLESRRRPGDGAQAWLGMVVVIACAAGCAVAVVFGLRRWWLF